MPLTALLLNPYVLLIKTEDIFSQRISSDLQETGYTVVVVNDIQRAWQYCQDQEPAMVIFDRTLTGDTGLLFCRQLRNTGYTNPILMVVDNENVEERVICLEAGADDYLLKPYHTSKFLQLINLYLQPRHKNTEQLRFGDLVLDLTLRKVLRKGKEIDLTVKEFELLKFLMSHPQQVLTRDQILENVWGEDFQGESNVIEVYIRYLRLKIEEEGQKRLIQTVRGVGYVLRES